MITANVTARGVKPRRVHRALVWAVLGLVVTGGEALALRPLGMAPRMAEVSNGSGTGETSLERLDSYRQVPDFALIERSGRSVTLADLRGRVWVVNFIYTRCTDTCPTQNLELSSLQGEFRTEPDFRLVSITADSERDTSEVLAQYAQRFGADPERWLFLSGPKRAIYRLAANGFQLSAVAIPGSKGVVIHSSLLVLVDRQSRIRAYHQSTERESLQRLRQNLQRLLREGR
ncbi:MAG: SCO family protein [Nitrospinae bacterium]|nr:SCO family protein [Nitrospinota bacterium]